MARPGLDKVVKHSAPRSFELDPAKGELHIVWTDGTQTRHQMSQLRRLCPCANCRTEREKMKESQGRLTSLRVLSSSAPAVTEAAILEVTPVGRYALSFRWNDGHTTGIYTYDFLREHQL